MTSDNKKLSVLKKQRHKAELSRYAHSRLKETKQATYRGMKFLSLLISILLTLAIGIYFRNIVSGDWLLIIMLCLAAAMTLIESLDNTIFRWMDSIMKHETAVQIWGHWIREADYLYETSSSDENQPNDEEIEKLNQKYIDCMDRTTQIPDKKFSRYKCEYKIKRLISEKIDGMDLEELQKTRIWRK